ncbi:MAG: hypothetical protein LBS81_05480 [Endomicrobium sp.]|jgi:hypothetical protein|nr:hypothetical protein [Endomicrobium sp.]
MKNINIFVIRFSNNIFKILLLLVIAVLISFMQANSADILSDRLKDLASSSAETNIKVLFYPIDWDSGKIDTSFFNLHNIEYRKSDSFMTAFIPVYLINELADIPGVKYIDLPAGSTLWKL